MGKKRKPEILPSASNIPTEEVLEDWARCIQEVCISNLLTPQFNFYFVFKEKLSVKAVSYQSKYPDYRASVARFALDHNTIRAGSFDSGQIRSRLCCEWQAYFYLAATPAGEAGLHASFTPKIVIKGYEPCPVADQGVDFLAYFVSTAYNFAYYPWAWVNKGEVCSVARFGQLPHVELQYDCVRSAYQSIADPAGFRFLLARFLEQEDLSGYMPGYYRAAFGWDHTNADTGPVPKMLKLERLCGPWWEMGWSQPEESVTAKRARRVEQIDL